MIAEVTPTVKEKDELVAHTRNLSYFSRLVEAERFEHLTLVEVQRRGLEHSCQVAMLGDGADWVQNLNQKARLKYQGLRRSAHPKRPGVPGNRLLITLGDECHLEEICINLQSPQKIDRQCAELSGLTCRNEKYILYAIVSKKNEELDIGEYEPKPI